MHPGFLKNFACGLVACAVATLLFCLFLIRAGEADISWVVKRQLRSEPGILFNSGLEGDFFAYKRELAREVEPAVIVLGSSRAMQARGAFFRGPFVNWGGAVGSVASLEATVSEVLRNPPRLAVLFVDMWWFNAAYADPRENYVPADFPRFPSEATIYEGGKLILRKVGNLRKLVPLPRNRLGLHAILANDGFDRAGSYHYVSTMTGEQASADAGFSDTFRRIREGTERFQYADHADPGLLARFLGSLAKLRAAGVPVVILFPPFAPKVNLALNSSGRYAYMIDLARHLRKEGIVFHDLTDASAIIPGASPDCEFVDGFHGGDVLTARVLLAAAASEPTLPGFLDLPYLHRFVSEHEGQAEGDGSFRDGHPETDFLHFGCHKRGG